MKNIRRFETTAEMESAVLEDVSVSYNVETGGVVAVNKPSIIDNSTMYTTFEALEDGVFSFVKKTPGDDIQYSKDNGSTWVSGEEVSVVTGDRVLWKSTIRPSSNGIGKFYSTNKFNVSGNIMSLLYGDDFKGQTSLEGKEYVFNKLFNGNSGLIDASNLILPATTLANRCYIYMFSGCTSLTTAPELPATTLAIYCYSGMFQGCTSLTTAPELPATTLVNYCYENMFLGCSSLTTAPELPATTLANYSYRGMFQGCTSLTTSPKLPATTLTFCCYQDMFFGCTSLNHITMLATDISAYNCLTYWVGSVSPTGTFVKHPDMTSLPTGVSGIPDGWTVEDAVL